jgi:hypothetical protein
LSGGKYTPDQTAAIEISILPPVAVGSLRIVESVFMTFQERVIGSPFGTLHAEVLRLQTGRRKMFGALFQKTICALCAPTFTGHVMALFMVSTY